MRRSLWLSFALLSATVVTAGCRGNTSSEPPVHLNQNMDFQQYIEAQEGSPFFSDGRGMRPPVEGTVAFGRGDFKASGTDAPAIQQDADLLKADPHRFTGRVDGRLVDALPASLPLTAALIDRGQERFQIFCTPCHDGAGTGNGLVIQRGFKVQPRSYHDPAVRAMPLGYFVDVMSNGKGTMQSYAAQVPVDDRWAIAAYIRTLQVSQAAKLNEVPAAIATEKGWNQ